MGLKRTIFLERLSRGESIIVAEGYIFEFERRGYLKAGTFVPEVVIDQPDLVRQLHEEFVHAGSDVVLAFTYYAHREKLKLIGREDELEQINLKALEIAREVADRTGTLMAGNICNSTVYEKGNPEKERNVEQMFKEQIEWAVRGGADFIVGETFGDYGEAKLALDCIKKYGNGLPAVITLSAPLIDVTLDGVPIVKACQDLEAAGAAIVGLNCGRGPATMLPTLKEIRKACKCPIAALPVPYRTSEKEPTFFSLTIPGTDRKAFPIDLPACLCSRWEIQQFAEECKNIGIQYVGLCCGNASHYLRIVAEVYGKNPPASKFSPEMDKHFIFGRKLETNTYFTEHVKSQIS
ncbi:hypothetical protein ACJMK2_015881 [Sinanodonta woodiana]|uniref:Hcy-binding domain-containing protein n=1 Tax=Sinanodonta woodiana TaxID=1069815 RepID=A0ABD3URU5_SINWO